jgi:hypothetical protein
VEDPPPVSVDKAEESDKTRHAYVYSFTGAGIESLVKLLLQLNWFDPTINSPGGSALNNQAKQMLIDMGIFPDPAMDAGDYKKQARKVVQALLELTGEK